MKKQAGKSASTPTENTYKSYQQLIIEATKCTPEDAIIVEDKMRNDIFHSTLNHLDLKEIRKGAREGYKVLLFERSPEGIAYIAKLDADYEAANSKPFVVTPQKPGKPIRQIIMEATKCPENEVDEIEQYMRDIVFHSTLSWQGERKLKNGARTAWGDIQFLRTPEGKKLMEDLDSKPFEPPVNG